MLNAVGLVNDNVISRNGGRLASSCQVIFLAQPVASAVEIRRVTSNVASPSLTLRGPPSKRVSGSHRQADKGKEKKSVKSTRMEKKR